MTCLRKDNHKQSLHQLYVGTFSAIPSSSEKGLTLQVRPDDSNIKACLPSTTMLAWESNSERG
jgi:hypothetical protein